MVERLYPYVNCLFELTLLSLNASSASANAATSLRLWPASVNNDREWLNKPTITSITTKAEFNIIPQINALFK